MLELLNNLNVAGKKALVVTPAADKAVYLSARNVKSIATSTAALLNTYSVLNAELTGNDGDEVTILNNN